MKPRALFSRHSYLKTPFLISLLFTVALSLVLLILYFSLQPEVPLFYSLAQPQDYLVPKQWLILFPLFSSGITLGHFALLRSIQNYGKVIQTLFAWTSVSLHIMLIVAFARIIYIIL